MTTLPLSRRDFMKNSAVAAAAIQLPAVLAAATASAASTSSTADAGNAVDLHWLEGGTPAVLPGTTWGMPWPRGRLPKDSAFAVRTAAGEPVPRGLPPHDAARRAGRRQGD